MSEFSLRTFVPADLPHLLTLFYETIHTVNAADYTPAQLDAWAPKDLSAHAVRWLPSLSQNTTVVAVAKDGLILGFGDLSDTGYFDRLFVHKDYQHQGIATAIADVLEDQAIALGCCKVDVHASITAKPFFEKRGYQVVKEQQVERLGQLLTNFVMEKPL